MTFESPEVLPAPTRRQNRRHSAASSTRAEAPTAIPAPEAAQPTLAESAALAAAVLAHTAGVTTPPVTKTPAAPLTRRAAREAARARVATEPAAERADAQPAASDVPEPPADADVADTDVDVFAEATRLFRAAQMPAAEAPQVAAAASEPRDIPETFVPSARRRRLRSFVTAGSTFAVMGLTGLLAVSMTLPSEAVAAAQGHHAFSSLAVPESVAADTPVIEEDEIQAFVASEDIVAEPIERSADQYSSISLIEVAASQGITYSDVLYSNDPEAAIQWPFMVGVAMSSPYGPRRGAMHEGIDLVPGNGAPIQVIADGVVRIASEAGGPYGVHVWVDHVIDGQAVSTHYAHMQYGSLQVTAGQKVSVGDILGKTGNTGRSYGPHLHFEVSVNGTKVNPLPWMQENAGRYEY